MLALRQLAAFIASGAQSDMSTVPDYDAVVTDVNPRYVMLLRDDGRFSANAAICASGGGSFALPLPQNYDSANRLFVLLRSDQSIKVTAVTAAGATNRVLLKAGGTQAILSFSDFIASLTVTNAGATNANVEWFLFEMPDITSTEGWRDGPLALGVAGNLGVPAVSPSPAPTPPTTVSYVDSVHIDYSGTNVDNSAWVQIIAATAGKISYLNIFHGFGAPVYLGVGAAGVEQAQLLIPPGGLPGAQFALSIPAGSRLSLKGVTATIINAGEFDLTGFV